MHARSACNVAVIQGTERTINASEGWHNRCQLLVGKSHPSLYSLLHELHKEQASIMYILRELSLGKRVKKLPTGRVLRVENSIVNQVHEYQTYVDENNELEYIKNLGHNLNL